MTACTVINESNRIFIEMPLGMPGRSSAKTGDGQSRVKYPTQECLIGWLRGVEMISFNCHENLTQQEQTARDHFNQIIYMVHLDFQQGVNRLMAIKKLTEPVETHVKKAEAYFNKVGIFSPEMGATVTIWKEYAEKKKQNSPQYSADDFACEKSMDFNSPQRLLDILKVSADDEYGQYVKIRPMLEKLGKDRLSSLDREERYDKMRRIAKKATYKEMGLTHSSWNPGSSFQQLREQLAQEGPLLLSGRFSLAYYRNGPSQLKDLFYKRQVWAWAPDAELLPTTAIVASRTIIVVGAWEKQEKAKTRELVYYKDVFDETDPQHPEQERLHVMSYDRLKKNADNLWAEKDTIVQSDYSVVSYAMYNPRIELKKA